MQGEKHERRQKNSPLKSQVKKIKKILKKVLTNKKQRDIIKTR